MRRIVVLGRILGCAAAVAALTLAACTSSGSYRAAVAGNPCTTGCSSPWAAYGKFVRGENPCFDGDNPCACKAPAPAPCAAAPCAPKPCAAPCAPKPCAKPCAKPCGKPCGCAPCAGPAVASAPCAPPPPAPCAREVMCKVEIPPVYETVYEDVETVCPRCTQVWVPPVSQIRMRDVCVRPPCSCEIDLPGVHRTETYCVEICPAHDEVVPGECGTTRTIRVPAQTETRTREICITPPERKVVYEPALYRTDAVPCEVKAGYWQTVTTPGVVERRPRIVCKVPGRTEWVRRTCGPGDVLPPGAVPIPSGSMPPPMGEPMPPFNPDRQPGDPVPPPPPPPTPMPEPTPTPMPVAPK